MSASHPSEAGERTPALWMLVFKHDSHPLDVQIGDYAELAARYEALQANWSEVYLAHITRGPGDVMQRQPWSGLAARSPAPSDEPQAIAPNQIVEAAHEAIAAIYFDDSSDFRGALWSIARRLAPDLAAQLEVDPTAAYDRSLSGVDRHEGLHHPTPRSSPPEQAREAADAERWRKLVALVAENHMHRGLGGGVILCAAPANEWDAAWASVQAIDHENPRNTLWMSEGASLDEAIDRSRSPLESPTDTPEQP